MNHPKYVQVTLITQQKKKSYNHLRECDLDPLVLPAEELEPAIVLVVVSSMRFLGKLTALCVVVLRVVVTIRAARLIISSLVPLSLQS